MTPSSAATDTNVAESVGRTPYSSADMKRVSASAEATSMTTPAPVTTAARPSTSARTSRGCAPQRHRASKAHGRSPYGVIWTRRTKKLLVSEASATTDVPSATAKR